jgi:hypothetical protein
VNILEILENVMIIVTITENDAMMILTKPEYWVRARLKGRARVGMA